jgi:hypothetical protein
VDLVEFFVTSSIGSHVKLVYCWITGLLPDKAESLAVLIDSFIVLLFAKLPPQKYKPPSLTDNDVYEATHDCCGQEEWIQILSRLVSHH